MPCAESLAPIEIANVRRPGEVRRRRLLVRAGGIVTDDLPEGVHIGGAARIDADGGWVMPGLIDAHVHLVEAGLGLTRLDLSGAGSREAFERLIERRHRALPPGRWLLAIGWDESNWGGDDPDRTWLRAAGDRPVVAARADLHVAVVNDAVLAMIAGRPCPPDGEIPLDADGRPTGRLVEGAYWKLVNPLVPAATSAERRTAVRAAQAHAHARGITAAGTMEYAAVAAEALEPLQDELTLRLRVTLLDRDEPLDVGLAGGFRTSEAFRILGFKAFADGTLGSRTARMKVDYADAPGRRGLLLEHAAHGTLDAWAQEVAAAGLQPAVHAIGDEAVRLAADALAPVDRRLRPRIEHVQQIDPADLSRLRGLVASMQPLHRFGDGRVARARLGDERLRGFFCFRSIRRAGARLAFGSDWPVVGCDPMPAIAAAVTARTADGGHPVPGERLDPAEALEAYTAGAAHALHLDRAGRIAPGLDADLAIVDRDPFACDWGAASPRVRWTIARGRVVHGDGPDGAVGLD